MNCPLTDTQINIVQRLIDGNARKIVAQTMGMPTSRLSQHLSSARDRSQTKTTEQLVALAVKRRWVK